jgi:hypothetical protein
MIFENLSVLIGLNIVREIITVTVTTVAKECPIFCCGPLEDEIVYIYYSE